MALAQSVKDDNNTELESPNTEPVVGRTLRQIAWMRLKRDWVARICLGTLVFILLVAIFAPQICSILGIDPYTFHFELLQNNSGLPIGKYGGISAEHPLGLEPASGRDVLARLMHGSRISLLVAFTATAISISIGVVYGIVAGNAQGKLDTVMSRFIDLMLAFPVLLIILAMSPVVEERIVALGVPQGNPARIVDLILVLSIFSWPYLARIIRGQVLSLREREFVEAAISLGSTNRRILFKELLPNLWGPIIVFTTLSIPGVISAEAGLAYLGVAVTPPTATWGQMLGDAFTYWEVDPTYFAIPLTLLIVVVLSFNLLGDALRDALDPKAGRS